MAVSDSEDEEPRDNSGTARLLMVAVLVLAVAATAVLVLSDSTKMLRLGVLAALWAALLGVFLASKFRKVAAEKENEAADLQSVYELELEREVAARREYELEIEAEARKRVEAANREDLSALRAELRVLRESLERLTGGEVLVERFALRAQSTRMRTLSGPEAQPRVVSADRRPVLAAEPRTVDPSTELMARPDVPTTAIPQPVAAAAKAARPQPQQPTRVARPVSRQQQAAIRTQQANPVTQPQPTQEVPQPPQEAWPGAEAERTGTMQVRRPRPVQPQPRPARPRPEPEPDPTTQLERSWPTSGDVSARLGGRVPEPPQVRRAVQPQRPESTDRSRHRSNERPVETTGGHRRVERDWKPEESGRTSTGRRAKVEQPSQWQEDDVETTGAHAAGRSVTELLAAHGNQEDSPRRHRRRAD